MRSATNAYWRAWGLVLLCAVVAIAAPVRATAQDAPADLEVYAVPGFHRQPRVTTHFLEDTFMTRPDEGWIVGARGTIIQYRDGRFIDWTDLQRTDRTLHHLSFCSPEVGWAVGGVGTIVSYRDGQWVREHSRTDNWLQAVTCVNEREAWAVGAEGVILRRVDGGWRHEQTPTGLALKGIAIPSPNDGWAIGSGVLLRRVGGRWQHQKLPVPANVELYGLAMRGPDDGWIVGQHGTILHWDGREWLPYPSPTTELLEEVQVGANGEAYACGWRGTVLRLTDGVWEAFPSLMNERLFGCHFTSRQRGLVVGHYGMMWVYDEPGRQALLPIVHRPR